MNTLNAYEREDFCPQFQHVLLKASHPIFNQGEICPVTKKCGIPLIIYSRAISMRSFERGGENQPAVYLRMECTDGIAPQKFVPLLNRKGH